MISHLMRLWNKVFGKQDFDSDKYYFSSKEMLVFFRISLPDIGKKYEFTQEQVLKLIQGVSIDPETEPIRHRLKTRVESLCNDMVIVNGESLYKKLLIEDLHSIIDTENNGSVKTAIKHIGDDDFMTSFLASLMLDHCLENEKICVIGVDSETNKPTDLLFVHDTDETQGVPTVQLVYGDDGQEGAEGFMM